MDPPNRSAGPITLWVVCAVLCWSGPASAVAGTTDEVTSSPESGVPLTTTAAEQAVRAARQQVEMIRGLEFKQEVPVQVVGDAEARRYVLERMDLFYSPDDLRYEQEAYILLGLLPSGTDMLELLLDVMEEQAGGFYNPSTKSFVLLDDMPRGSAPILAAHELTHALEDQHFDLDARLGAAMSNQDLSFARSALHEGSAMLVMTLFTTAALANGIVSLEDLQAMEQTEAATAERLKALPDALKRPLLGSYLLGMDFLVRGDLTRTVLSGFPRKDVDRCYSQGPVSSEQILHPEKFWSPAQYDAPQSVDLGDAGQLLGGRWSRLASGVLGELVLGALVDAPTPLAITPESVKLQGAGWSNAASAGWDGDRWELWGRKRQRVVLLRTVWDSPADAREFAGALPAAARMRWRVLGSEVALVSGDLGRKADAVLDALLAVARR